MIESFFFLPDTVSFLVQGWACFLCLPACRGPWPPLTCGCVPAISASDLASFTTNFNSAFLIWGLLRLHLVHLDNLGLSHLEMLNLITSEKSLLLHKVTNSQVWGLEHECCGGAIWSTSVCFHRDSHPSQIKPPHPKVLKRQPITASTWSLKSYLDLTSS